MSTAPSNPRFKFQKRTQLFIRTHKAARVSASSNQSVHAKWPSRRTATLGSSSFARTGTLDAPYITTETAERSFGGPSITPRAMRLSFEGTGRPNFLGLSELALVLVRLDDVISGIVNADDGIM